MGTASRFSSIVKFANDVATSDDLPTIVSQRISSKREIHDRRSVPLGAAYQNADHKYANAADNYLKCGAKKWSVHVATADPANHEQLDRND